METILITTGIYILGVVAVGNSTWSKSKSERRTARIGIIASIIFWPSGIWEALLGK